MKASNNKIREIIRKEVGNIFNERIGNAYGASTDAPVTYPAGSIEYPLFEPWNEPVEETKEIENAFYSVYYVDTDSNGKLKHKVIDDKLSKNEARLMIDNLEGVFPNQTFYFDVDTSLN